MSKFEDNLEVLERPTALSRISGDLGVSQSVPPEALTQSGHFQYNRNLIQAAQKNRRNPTLAENIFWKEVVSKEQTSFKFRRQKTIENFILDFYCAELLLCVEIDGEYHESVQVQDQVRTERLNILGIKVIRFTNEQVLTQINEVKENLMEEISIRTQSLKPPLRGLGVKTQ